MKFKYTLKKQPFIYTLIIYTFFISFTLNNEPNPEVLK